jgi:GT2 family glycosyltransferase
MDDDAIADPDALRKMLPYGRTVDVAAIANMKLGANGQVDHAHVTRLPHTRTADSIPLLSFSSFVGLMVSRRAIDKIGLPKAELFLYFDDIEYCARLCGTGKIVLAEDATIVHKETSRASDTVCRFGRNFSFYSTGSFSFRFYFSWRNRVWVVLHSRRVRLRGIPPLVWGIIAYAVRILVIDRIDIIPRLHVLFRAVADGALCRFDNGFAFHMRDRWTTPVSNGRVR